MPKIGFLTILLISFFSGGLLIAGTQPEQKIAEWKKDDLHFLVRQAASGPFLLASEVAVQQLPPGRADTFLGLTVEFFNRNPRRKIDLTADFQYQLRDEFQNVYRQVEVPGSGLWAGFPKDLTPMSIYPEGTYRKTIFFEAPVAASKNLTLTVNATNMDYSEPVSLNIHREQISDRTPLPPLRFPKDDDLQVLAPKTGTPVRPGTVVHIGIQIPADVRQPNGIYIISPNDVFEDTGSRYQYDVRIPRDQPQGPFIVVVLARWDQEQEIVLSKSVSLEVTREVPGSLEPQKSNHLD